MNFEENHRLIRVLHYVSRVRIRSFSGPYFPRIRTTKTPNTNTFYAVLEMKIIWKSFSLFFSIFQCLSLLLSSSLPLFLSFSINENNTRHLESNSGKASKELLSKFVYYKKNLFISFLILFCHITQSKLDSLILRAESRGENCNMFLEGDSLTHCAWTVNLYLNVSLI